MKKEKVGRKSKWETNIKPNLDRIPKLKKQGYTDRQIAQLLGVAYSTFNEYIIKHPELKELLKKGKEQLIEDLEDTLFRKALGLIKIKETKKYIKKSQSGEQETRIEEVEKEIPPDTASLIFALKNLSPERWKDNHDVSFKGMREALENFQNVSEEVLKNLVIDDEDN